MLYRDDVDTSTLFADSIDHTEVTAPRTVEACEFKPEGLSDPLRVVCKRAVAEFDDGGGDLFGER